MNRIKMTRVVGGKRYNTETATCIASNVYWDGNNFERSGRNTWLYKTPLGAFFSVCGTCWQGERDNLDPHSRDEAIDLYEHFLPEHPVTWEQAFDETPSEPEGDRGFTQRVRLTAAERATLEAEAAKLGQTMSEYARRKIFPV